MIAEVRPRNRWEAMDLGLVLARTRYVALLKAWALMVWPVWAIILVSFRSEPLWGLALIWWLKPLAERVPLLVLSREMFGETLSLRKVLRQWPRVWLGGLFHYLVSTRLSPARHVLLPVRELEELRGQAFRQRAARIASQCGFSSWTMQAMHLVFLHSLSASVFIFVIALIPERYSPDWELFFEVGFGEDGAPAWCVWVWIGLYLTSLTLITPFCVAAGFGLYLNARTKMEGWDIELAFRRLAARIGPAALVVAMGCALILPAFAVDDKGWDAGAAMDEILAKPEFKIHTETEFRPVDEPKEMPDWFDWWPEMPNWFAGFPGLSLGFGGVSLASGFVWILVGLAVAVVIVLLAKWLVALQAFGRGRGDTKEPVVATVMGMNVRQDSLPRDIVAAARKLLAAGDFQEAMALLYRGALSWLIHRAEVPIQESDTEGDCLDRVRQAEAVTAPYFEQLTRVWIAAAYGSRRAGGDDIERLLELWPYVANRKEAR